MKFDEAYEKLLQGKRIRRKDWESLTHLKVIDQEVKTFRQESVQYYVTANLLLSGGWCVLDGDKKEMPFVEALEYLKKKQKVYRAVDEWPEDQYLFVDNGQFALCRPVQYDFMPTFKCLCADDWEILK